MQIATSGEGILVEHLGLGTLYLCFDDVPQLVYFN
jgi:hypothetical protein